MTVPYKRAFTKRVHELLAKGYSVARSDLTSTLEEEVITEKIAFAIDDIINDPNSPSIYSRFYVNIEPRVRHGNRTGKRRKRLDLALKCTTSVPHPELLFEAKRLRAPGHPVGTYLGKNGLLCFVTEEYGKESHTGVMLGYFQSNDLPHWQNKIISGCQGKHKLKTALLMGPIAINVVPALPGELLSLHNRTTLPISIYHILLDCT